MEGPFRVLLTTCPEDDAPRIAQELLLRRAVACVNIVRGVESRYWWQGSIETSREALLLLKSVEGKIAAVTRTLRELHPSQVFELLALPVVAGSVDYLRWLREVTAPARAPRDTPRSSTPAKRRARRK